MTGLLGKLVEHFAADPFIGQEFEVAMQDDLAREPQKFLRGIEASGSFFQIGLGNGISTIPPVWMWSTSALPKRNSWPPKRGGCVEVRGHQETSAASFSRCIDNDPKLPRSWRNNQFESIQSRVYGDRYHSSRTISGVDSKDNNLRTALSL